MGNGNNGGASGSFFFFTEDKQFIIKTMSTSEKVTFMRMLPSMTQFIMETGGKTLISRIYGLYMVEYPGMAPVYLMLQKNNIKLDPGNDLMNIFDIKGSKYTRQVVPTNDMSFHHQASMGSTERMTMISETWMNEADKGIKNKTTMQTQNEF